MAEPKPEDIEATRRIFAHLRQALAETGISQNELARRLGRTSGGLSRLMKAERQNVSAGFALLVAQVLPIDPRKLLFENAAPQYYRGGPPPPPLSVSVASARARGLAGKGGR